MINSLKISQYSRDIVKEFGPLTNHCSETCNDPMGRSERGYASVMASKQ